MRYADLKFAKIGVLCNECAQQYPGRLVRHYNPPAKQVSLKINLVITAGICIITTSLQIEDKNVSVVKLQEIALKSTLSVEGQITLSMFAFLVEGNMER